MTDTNKTLGILGGGQLGRMTAMAAARLGIRTHIFCPESDSPAAQVSARTFNGAYDDTGELERFAKSVDVITYEFENIPLETIRFLQKFCAVYPDDRLLEIAQNRAKEKQFLNDINIPTAQWAIAHSPDELKTAATGFDDQDLILKTTRFGYDGKGQASFTKGDNHTEKWNSLNAKEIIIEKKIDFDCEVSVIIARDIFGHTALYGPILNEHRDHILSRSLYPAPVHKELADKTRQLTTHLADAINLTGVMALEMFVTADGELLANEIAPRPHNSGHWTIDACGVSQFEQHVRTVCGLPIGQPQCLNNVVMINLLGEDVLRLDKFYETPNAHIHLYGKQEIRPGRKMGHITLTDQENI